MRCHGVRPGLKESMPWREGRDKTPSLQASAEPPPSQQASNPATQHRGTLAPPEHMLTPCTPSMFDHRNLCGTTTNGSELAPHTGLPHLPKSQVSLLASTRVGNLASHLHAGRAPMDKRRSSLATKINRHLSRFPYRPIEAGLLWRVLHGIPTAEPAV